MVLCDYDKSSWTIHLFYKFLMILFVYYNNFNNNYKNYM